MKLSALWLLLILLLFTNLINTFQNLKKTLYDSWFIDNLSKTNIPQLDLTDYQINKLSPSSLRQLASAIYRKGVSSNNSEDLHLNLCHAKEILNQALRIDTDSRAITSLVKVEIDALIGLMKCPNMGNISSDSLISLQKQIDFLISFYKNDPEILSAAGRISLRYKYDELAIKAFSHLLRIRINPSLPERQMIRKWLIRDNNIELALPELLPIVIFWSSEIYNLLHSGEDAGLISVKNLINHSEDQIYSSIYNSLANKQNKALSIRRKQHSKGEIPTDVFINELLRLVNITFSDSIRREAESIVVRLADFTNQITTIEKNILNTRSNLSLLDTVVGIKLGDYRPASTGLNQWRWQNDIVLDGRNNSIGFFLGSKQSVFQIEINSYSGISLSNQRAFSIYSSDDNNKWIIRDSEIANISPIELNGRYSLIIQFKEPISSRFFKLNYLARGSEAKVFGRPSSLIRVYGNKLKKK